MSISELKLIDKIEITELGIVIVREATRIMKDEEVIATTFHRWSFAPASDISSMPENVQAIAQVVWTPEVIAAYQAQLEANRLGQ